jgi:hypothetical protein
LARRPKWVVAGEGWLSSEAEGGLRMAKEARDPSIVKDLGALADLYRTFFWMMGQRIQHGPGWQQRLEKEVLDLTLQEASTLQETRSRN